MKEVIPKEGYTEYNVGEYQLWINDTLSDIVPSGKQCIICDGKNKKSNQHKCYVWKNPGKKGSYKGVFCIGCMEKYKFTSGNVENIKYGMALLRMKHII